MLGSSSRVCIVCARAAAKYNCPRCNTPHCSLPCFKEHGSRCTESFYEAQVRSHLKLASAPQTASSAPNRGMGASSVEADFLQLAREMGDPASSLSSNASRRQCPEEAPTSRVAGLEVGVGALSLGAFGRGDNGGSLTVGGAHPEFRTGLGGAGTAGGALPEEAVDAVEEDGGPIGIDRLLAIGKLLFAAPSSDAAGPHGAERNSGGDAAVASKVLACLTPSERRAFLRSATSGSLTGLGISDYSPWWIAESNKNCADDEDEVAAGSSHDHHITLKASPEADKGEPSALLLDVSGMGGSISQSPLPQSLSAHMRQVTLQQQRRQRQRSEQLRRVESTLPDSKKGGDAGKEEEEKEDDELGEAAALASLEADARVTAFVPCMHIFFAEQRSTTSSTTAHSARSSEEKTVQAPAAPLVEGALASTGSGHTAALPAVSCILKGGAAPSALLPAHIAQVLLAYAHVSRLYAGDMADDAVAAADALLHLAPVLLPPLQPTPSAATAAAGAASPLSGAMSESSSEDAARRRRVPTSLLEALSDTIASSQEPAFRMTAVPDTRLSALILWDACILASQRHFAADALLHVQVLLDGAAGVAADDARGGVRRQHAKPKPLPRRPTGRAAAGEKEEKEEETPFALEPTSSECAAPSGREMKMPFAPRRPSRALSPRAAYGAAARKAFFFAAFTGDESAFAPEHHAAWVTALRDHALERQKAAAL